jgi:hypothetical protein
LLVRATAVGTGPGAGAGATPVPVDAVAAAGAPATVAGVWFTGARAGVRASVEKSVTAASP